MATPRRTVRPFTQKAVRGHCRAALGTASNRKLPSGDVLKWLTKRLNEMARTYRVAGTDWPEQRAIAERIEAAIAELRRLLPGHIENLLHVVNLASFTASERDAFDAVLLAVNALPKPAFSFLPPTKNMIALGTSKGAATVIAAAFRRAIDAANPTQPALGISNAGPVVRFVAVMLPKVTGGPAKAASTIFDYLDSDK